MNSEKNEKPVRLQVYLAKAGIASRRKSEEIIKAGKVSVNNSIITEMGFLVYQADIVKVENTIIKPIEQKKYFLLNKPPYYLCSNYDPQGRKLALSLITGISDKERLFHVGRLDFLSEGLILYTNDGKLTRFITHPSSEIEKEYEIKTYESIDKSFLLKFEHGVSLNNIIYKLRAFTIIDSNTVTVTLIEGKNRELRNVFTNFGYHVRYLKRIRIGNIQIDKLKPGEFRELSEKDLEWFFKRMDHGSND